MKVLLVNGGPHPKGCTNRALEEVEKALKEEGIETLIYHIPNVPLQDCIACGSCAKTGKCVFSKYYSDKDENTLATMERKNDKLTALSKTINDDMLLIAMSKIANAVSRDLQKNL